MEAFVNSKEIAEVEPIWLTVARVGAGFRRMEQLAGELVELDAVRQDVVRTQAMIRRDIAGAVLQNALCLREFQSEPAIDVELSRAVLAPVPVAPPADEWAARLVRWADQFGRDLFKLPNMLIPAAKRDTAHTPRWRNRKS